MIGGRSSRLGTDKAFVEFEGETLAGRSGRIVETALSPDRIVFVAASNTQFNRDLLDGLGHPVISDAKPDFGPWSGLHAALANAQSEWVFILACDLPFISVDLLLLLSGFADDSIDAVVPRQPDGRLQPLCAFYRAHPTVTAVEAILAAGGRLPPLAALCERLKTSVINMTEYDNLKNASKLLLNINTEADLAAAG